jgi:alanine dehydrogenase
MMSQPKPFTHRSAAAKGLYELDEAQIASLLRGENLSAFLLELAAEIERTYHDAHLEPLTRSGWTKHGDAFEVMGCASRDYTVVKAIASNPSTSSQAVPTVSGYLYAVKTGTNQAVLRCDVPLLTALRTATSTFAVLRRAAPEVKSVAVVGAGLEGETHAFVLSLLASEIQHVVFADVDSDKAEQVARKVVKLLKLHGRNTAITVSRSPGMDEIYATDVIVTATYGRAPVVQGRRVRPGTFIAAVGADLEGKQELDADVYSQAKFLADDLGQCLRQGELQHATGTLQLPSTHSSYLGALGLGRVLSVGDFLSHQERFSGRDESIIVYDSTGFSGQDLATVRVLLHMLGSVGWTRKRWPRAMSLWQRLTVAGSLDPIKVSGQPRQRPERPRPSRSITP